MPLNKKTKPNQSKCSWCFLDGLFKLSKTDGNYLKRLEKMTSTYAMEMINIKLNYEYYIAIHGTISLCTNKEVMLNININV